MAVFNSYETEISVLGLLLSNEKTVQEAVGRLEERDFELLPNKVIFSTIKKLYDDNKVIDLVSVLSALKNTGDVDKIGKPEYLSDLIASAGLPSNIESYIGTLKSKAKLRDLKSFLDNSQNYLNETNDEVDSVIEKMEEDIFKVTRESTPKKEEAIGTAVDEYVTKIKSMNEDDELDGMATEFKELDSLIHGFRKGDLVVVAARPSMGKTAFSLGLATNVARNKSVYYFSLEMPTEQIAQRILSSTAFIDGKILKNPNNITNKDWSKIQQTKPAIEKLQLVIDDTAGLKIGELVWKIRNYAMNKPLDLVIIDYMQLITQGNSSGNRQQDVSDISRTLKLLARELNIPVVVLAQLNRSVEKREDKRPLMSDIRESGAIEQDADIIMFLYREGYYKQEKNTSTQPVEVIVQKNRNGATGTSMINLHMASGRFSG